MDSMQTQREAAAPVRAASHFEGFRTTHGSWTANELHTNRFIYTKY